jgi:TPR repeat protein
MMLRAIVTACFFCLLSVAPGASEGKSERLALVVGVSAYGAQSLANAASDAMLASSALEKAGFTTTLLIEPTKGQMRAAIAALAEAVNQAGNDTTVAFYFSGHGVQFGGENYLIPSATDLFQGTPAVSDFEDQSVRAQWILDKLSETAAARILLVLDACRTNPFRSDRRSLPDNNGLAKMSAVPGGPDTMIIFAAEPRFAAFDGPEGQNSFFSRAFAETIALPGLDISEVFNVVRERVRVDAKDRQRPHLEGLFRFVFVQSAQVREPSNKFGIAMSRVQSGEDGFELLREALRTRTIADIKQAADGGDGFAMYLLGLAHWDGMGGLKPDLTEAVRLMRRAVARGVGRAAGSLGYYYCCADDGPKNQTESVEWFRVGMDLGSPGSIRNLAFSYRDGTGVPKDLIEAERHFLLAVERGMPRSYSDIAWLYRSEDYGQVNMAKALEFYQRALDAGYARAATDIAAIYQFGEGVAKDVGKAINILESAAPSQCAECWTALGTIYSDENVSLADATKASNAYLHGAEGGDAEAMLIVGRRMRKGEGIAKDEAEGFRWLDRAREAGNLEAIGAAGQVLARGEGVARDPERAAALLRAVLEIEQDPKKRFKVYVPNYWGYGRSLAELHETGGIQGASKEEAARLYARYGKKDGAMKRFTVPVTCGKLQSPFFIYLIDWERDEPSTDEQWEWLKSERGCTAAPDVVESFRKLFKIARDNKVAFTDLTVYALSNADADKNNDAPPPIKSETAQ